MPKVKMSTTLYVPASAVWNMVGGFNQLARWHPAVASSEEKKDKGATIRKLTLHGGGTIIEKLDGLDPKERTYSYSILESPLPVAGYKAKLHVTEAEDGRSCTVEWSSEFEASGAPENEAVKIIRSIYEAGFENLQRLFGGST
jgi:Polyketide cyclase / dehydrase and lipid transport